MYMYMYMCMYVYVCMYICIYIYIYCFFQKHLFRFMKGTMGTNTGPSI